MVGAGNALSIHIYAAERVSARVQPRGELMDARVAGRGAGDFTLD
jgi:hypothetical protein